MPGPDQTAAPLSPLPAAPAYTGGPYKDADHYDRWRDEQLAGPPWWMATGLTWGRD